MMENMCNNHKIEDAIKRKKYLEKEFFEGGIEKKLEVLYLQNLELLNMLEKTNE